MSARLNTLLQRSLVGSCLIAACVFVAHVTAQDAEEIPKAEPVPTAQPSDSSAPTPAEPIRTATPSVRPLSVTVELITSGKAGSDSKIMGTLTDTTQMEMRTSFGVVQIPLSEVAGFRFPSADDASTTVVMLNGDSITGATNVELVTVETEWGVAEINGQSIQSLLFVPGLTWNASKGLNGTRWTLTNPPAAGSTRSSSGGGLSLPGPGSSTGPRPSGPRPSGQPLRIQPSRPSFGN